jgi:hypothetical protein
MAQTQTLATLKDVIKKFLVSVCRFTADATKEITKNQGYDELDEFYLLNNKGVDTLCSIVIKPHTSASGSTSGHAVSNLAQERLKLAIFAMKHFKQVSREIDLDSLTKKDIIRVVYRFYTGSLAGIGIDIPYTGTRWLVFRSVFLGVSKILADIMI